MPSYVVFPSIEKPHKLWLRTSRQMFHLSNSPLFESRVCTPAGHAHYWHTSSSGHNATLGLFARGKQSQNHLQDWERNHIKLLFLKEVISKILTVNSWSKTPNKTKLLYVQFNTKYDLLRLTKFSFPHLSQAFSGHHHFGNWNHMFIFPWNYFNCFNLCLCNLTSIRLNKTKWSGLIALCISHVIAAGFT